MNPLSSINSRCRSLRTEAHRLSIRNAQLVRSVEHLAAMLPFCGPVASTYRLSRAECETQLAGERSSLAANAAALADVKAQLALLERVVNPPRVSYRLSAEARRAIAELPGMPKADPEAEARVIATTGSYEQHRITPPRRRGWPEGVHKTEKWQAKMRAFNSTPEKRAKHSAYMKAYHAKRRAQLAAAAAAV